LSLPALISMGLATLTSHSFVCYYALCSAITPPVSLAAFAASAIAKTNPLQLSITAVRIAAVGFIVPLMWVYHPELLPQPGSDVSAMLTTLPLVVLAIVCLSAAQVGYIFRPLGMHERTLLLIAAAVLVWPGMGVASVVTAVLVVAAFALLFNGKNQRVTAA